MALVEVRGLGKSYGTVRALSDVSFTARPGRVTGLLGPNGSGKSTALRLMLGLDHGAGRTLYDGTPYRDLDRPATRVGALLDPRCAHPGMRALDHLRMQAAGMGVAPARCAEVLDEVGLAPVARRRTRGWSMGMTQRLGLASALIGRPDTLLLDEPANGLDAEGMAWLRTFLTDYVARGHTLLLSSHLLADLQEYVDDVVVIARGRVVAEAPLSDFLRSHGDSEVLVRTDDTTGFARVLRGRGAAVTGELRRIRVRGLTPEAVGALARRHGHTVHELVEESVSLQRAYLAVSAAAGHPGSVRPADEPHPPGGGVGVRRTLAYEWRRLVGVRGTWAVLVVALLLSVGVAAAYAAVVWLLLQDGYRVSAVEALVVTVTKPQLAPVAGGLLGLAAVAGDRRHRTAMRTYLVEPRRHRVLLATVVVVTTLTLALATLGVAASLVVSRLVLGGGLGGVVDPADVLLAAAGLLVACVGWVVWGVAVGTWVRSPVGGVLLLLGVPFVAERALRAAGTLLADHGVAGLAGHLPFASAAALQAAPTVGAPVVLAGSGDPWLAALVFAGFAAGCLALAVRVLGRCDLGTAA